MFSPFRAAVSCTLCLLLGCGYAARTEMYQKVESELDECLRLYPSETQRPITPRLKCVWDARMKAAHFDADRGYRHIDLDELLRSKLFLIGEQYDLGKMTEAQYRLEKAQAVSAYQSERQRRENGAAMVAAAQYQAASASAPVTCTTVAGTTTCY